MECETCGSKEDLLDAINDQGEKVKICRVCFESMCEGYTLVED